MRWSSLSSRSRPLATFSSRRWLLNHLRIRSFADLVLPFKKAAQPRQLLIEARILAAFLVGPVGGDAELGHAVHLVRPDLDLDRLASVGDDRGVERLIAI